MEEFRQHLNQFYLSSEQIDIKHLIAEIELIGRQLKSSQEFFHKEIQRFKHEVSVHSTRLNHANELREIDQKTLKIFQTKFQDLSQLLAEIRKKEMNTWHLVQILRVNTSRLWHIFESATGSTITQEILYEDLQNLLHQSEIDNEEQRSIVNSLEKQHADLLLQTKEIQLSLEHFRTTILHITQTTTTLKFQLQTQQQNNTRTSEQIITKIHQFIDRTKEIYSLLLDYKSLVLNMDQLLNIIFHNQTQIEMHHKSIIIYQMKLEKYQQDLTFTMLNRTNCQKQIFDLRKILQQQNRNLQQFDTQQMRILRNRRQFHQQIHRLEQDKTRIFNHQQQLLERIKQTTIQHQLLEKRIFQSNQSVKNLNFSYRKLIQDQNKQHHITHQLYRTIDTNNQRLEITKTEIDQFNDQINQQHQFIDDTEDQIQSKTKELNNLETCLSSTHEELQNYRTKVNDSKLKVQSLTQNMHRLMVDEKPLTKEIIHYQKQVIQNQINHKRLEVNFKQNETTIIQYRTIIGKLIGDSKEDHRLLIQENIFLKQYQHQIERSKDNITKLTKNLQYSEDDYQDLKEFSHCTEKENRQLREQYADLTFVVQLLGQRQAILNNQLKPLYKKIQLLTKDHLYKVQQIEQSKSDLTILHKYYLHLRTYRDQLSQSLAFASQEHYEYLHSQSLSTQLTTFHNQLHFEMKNHSNHIHYWQTLMISSPEKFEGVSKLLLIKKKLVKKSNELIHLKQIFLQQNTLYRYLNGISMRRQRLVEKLERCPTLNDQLIKQKRLRKELRLDKDRCESTMEKSIVNMSGK